MSENTSSTIKQKIAELNSKIKALNKDLAVLFENNLAELINKYQTGPLTLKSLNVYVNNHDFNDGDETSFSLYYDSLTLNFEDELGNIREVEESYGEKTELDKVRDEFVNFFGEFDVANFYEIIFGDQSETMTFTVDKEGKLKY